MNKDERIGLRNLCKSIGSTTTTATAMLADAVPKLLDALDEAERSKAIGDTFVRGLRQDHDEELRKERRCTERAEKDAQRLRDYIRETGKALGAREGEPLLTTVTIIRESLRATPVESVLAAAQRSRTPEGLSGPEVRDAVTDALGLDLADERDVLPLEALLDQVRAMRRAAATSERLLATLHGQPDTAGFTRYTSRGPVVNEAGNVVIKDAEIHGITKTIKIGKDPEPVIVNRREAERRGCASRSVDVRARLLEVAVEMSRTGEAGRAHAGEVCSAAANANGRPIPDLMSELVYIGFLIGQLPTGSSDGGLVAFRTKALSKLQNLAADLARIDSEERP